VHAYACNVSFASVDFCFFNEHALYRLGHLVQDRLVRDLGKVRGLNLCFVVLGRLLSIFDSRGHTRLAKLPEAMPTSFFRRDSLELAYTYFR
jgi:hypothetical protein